MDPLGRKGWQNNGRDGSPVSTPGRGQSFPQETSLVVLGVMFPSAVPQPFGLTAEESPHFRSDVASGGKNTNVIFYDPISSIENTAPVGTPCTGISGAFLTLAHDNRNQGSRSGRRADAMKAVARDLADLALRKRRG